MMQSPNSDSGQGSPASSSPSSPTSNIIGSQLELKTRYQDDEIYAKDIKQKFSVHLNKENNGLQPSQNNGAQSNPTAISRNNLDQILYPKTTDRDLLETSAKFSIERLKQLADQRLSPSNIENNSLTNNKIFSIDHSLKYSNNNNNINSVPSINNINTSTIITTTSPTTTILNNGDNPIQTHQHIHSHQHAFSNHQHLNILNQNSFSSLKYGINNNSNNNNNNNDSSDLDIERIKFARSLTNGKELSDFGFRIQLGGLTTNYAHSETSEELNVDGNEDSSQDGHSVSKIIP